MDGFFIRLIKEFEEFISKGNVVGLATAVVFGVAFNAVVTSFITNIITPIIGIPGHINVGNLYVTVNGSTITYGAFINAIINFIVISFVLFVFFIRPIAKMQEAEKKKHVTTKKCPYCLSEIDAKATRCAFCTSKI
ncbi:MAG: large conductance mechanosensitive channel protein MscL [Candidatus Micrarchaeota archaeon]|nr:large conductance mechanosensitive channel protein MscL [Candidatus Micrarchaeota archaeon]MDE1804249.1 large conductance mechanosensitive channel protein MscL [Candidatus Micrarchaeota archaeon]MDE1846979.1 large conductance mechanosensitive channel protein MscL [Candidatus Micrarchaeota archaeon]